MAIERAVVVNGATCRWHRLAAISLVVGDHVTLTVESFADEAMEGEPRVGFHELPWRDGMTVAEATEALLASASFAEEVAPPTAAQALESAGLLDAIEASQMTEEQEGAYLALFPAWEAGAAYGAGERVTHGGALYRVVQAHTSQGGWEPQLVPALFAVALRHRRQPRPRAPAEWAQPAGAHDAYMAGDRVTHGGRVWESLLDGNVWPPGQYPPGWREVA